MSDDAPYIIAAFFGIALLITYIIMAGMSDIHNHECIDRGGAPVNFLLYTKGVGSGTRCITDYKVVEVK